MTVMLGYDPEAGFFLLDMTGTPVASIIWFCTEDEAIDYCDAHDLTLFHLGPDMDEDK